MTGDHPLVLGHVRVIAPQENTSAARAALGRQIARALDQVTLAPPGFPPHAILVVRRLSDPLPGALLADQSWRAAGRWGAEARAVMAQIWRSARRPALGPVPPETTAVWFSDAAEWLACLTWDVYRGLARERWWWETWLRQGAYTGSHSLSALWQAEARWLPAALDLLVIQYSSGVLGLVHALTAHEAAAVRRALLAAYELPPADNEVALPLAELIHLIAAPFRAWVSPHSDTPPDHLLALTLALHAAPSTARQALQQAAHAPDQTPRAPRRADSTEAMEQPAVVEPSAAEQQYVPPSRDRAAQPPSPSQNRITSTVADRSDSPDGSPHQHTEVTHRQQGDSRAAAPITPKHDGSGQVGTDTFAAPHRTAEPGVSDSRADQVQSEGVRTGLGGVWYLVNVLTAVNALDGQSNPWTLLATLARALLADIPPDPLWAILEELAGPEARTDDSAHQHWLAESMPAIQVELSARLPDPTVLVERLADPAVLYVTRTHIDVVFTLNQIDLELRRAGLDRNPGWVPQFARVIAFHFD